MLRRGRRQRRRWRPSWRQLLGACESRTVTKQCATLPESPRRRIGKITASGFVSGHVNKKMETNCSICFWHQGNSQQRPRSALDVLLVTGRSPQRKELLRFIKHGAPFVLIFSSFCPGRDSIERKNRVYRRRMR